MIKTFIFILLFSTTLLAAGSYSDNNSDNVESSSAEDQINKLYNKAYELVYAKKFDKSIKLLKKIAKRNDLGLMKADIYNLLGYSYRKNDNPDLDKAFESYKIAIEVDPEHLGAHEYLGELYLTLGDKFMAEKMLTKLEKIAGTDTDEYNKLQKAISKF